MLFSLTDRISRLLYPPLCVSCRSEIDSMSGLCPSCWKETNFINGSQCDMCACPLPGVEEDHNILCDGCLSAPQAWSKGRAGVTYEGVGRRVALALKHGDRLDIAVPMAGWMLGAGRDVLDCDVIVPVPLHWTRLLRRKFNQAAVLGNLISQRSGVDTLPDLLVRHKRTIQQKGMSRQDRFLNQQSAISVADKYSKFVVGKRILLIDDVMTTGATLSACAEACLSMGAETVNVLVFARVAQRE